MSAKLRVDVTQEQIDSATQRDSRRCMIAEAITAAHPKYTKVMVDLATIRWTNPRTKKRYVCLTPEAAGIALVAFDQGEEVKPFSMSLVAVQVTPTQRVPKPKAEGEPTYREIRGPRRLAADGTIRGGQPLVTGHLGNVKVSRNDVRVFGRRLLRG